MALRFNVVGLPKGLKPASVLETAPALRAPEDVRFRRGADLRKVAAQVLQHPRVRVMAAVNAGKSSGLPKYLAMVSRLPVIYVTANPMMADESYQFACKQANDGVEFPPVCRYTRGAVESVPRSGIIFCSAADYVVMITQYKFAESRVPEHVVFLDEAHKSDMCTHICRELCGKFGATCLVMASATFDLEAGFRREGGGKVDEHMYDYDVPVSEWSVSDRGKPWSVHGLQDNIVIFTDSRTDASHLVHEYELSGVPAFRLTADMESGAFQQAKRAALDKTGPPVAFIADSSFRDGFRFTASRAVDTARVGFYKYVPGSVNRVYRELYYQERVQTSGRFARGEGEHTDYYYPRCDYPKMACDLEDTEMEAAAYMFRILGFQPSGELAAALMSSDVLPDRYDFSTVVNAKYPLPHYTRNAAGQVRPPSPVTILPTARRGADSNRMGEPDWYDAGKAQRRDSGLAAQVNDERPMSGLSGRTAVGDVPGAGYNSSYAGKPVDGDRSRAGDSNSVGGVADIGCADFEHDLDIGGPGFEQVGPSREYVRPRSNGSSSRDSGNSSDWIEDKMSEVFRELHVGEDVGVVRVGDYAQVTLPMTVPQLRSSFPRGYDSVCAFLPAGDSPGRLAATAHTFDMAHRDRALKLLLDKYNVDVAYYRAIASAMLRVYQEGLHDKRGPGFTDEVASAMEAHAKLKVEMRFVLDRIGLLADGYYGVRVLHGEVEAERDKAEQYYRRFKSLTVQRFSGDDAHRVSRRIRESDCRSSHEGSEHSSSMSMRRLDGSGSYVTHHKVSRWTGLRRVTQVHSRDGSLQETVAETNLLGRLITGYEELVVPGSRPSSSRSGSSTDGSSRRSIGSRVTEIE